MIRAGDDARDRVVDAAIALRRECAPGRRFYSEAKFADAIDAVVEAVDALSLVVFVEQQQAKEEKP